MRVFRWFGLASVTALVGGALWVASASGAAAYQPTVVMLDNDARPPSQGFDPGRGLWGYGPDYLMVRRGESVRFVNPGTNFFPHTVTSIEMGPEGPFSGALAVGGKFDSSPSREALVQRGSEWTMDTSNLEPGNYSYYCRIHPWMVAKLTVTE